MSGPIPRPGILDVSPYRGGPSRAAPGVRPHRLASNECALGTSPLASAAYKAVAGELHRYPDGDASALRTAIAGRFGLEAERIVCGDGSDELLHLLCQAYAGPGDDVLYSEHGFLVYPIAAKCAGARPVTAPEPDFRCNVDAVLGALTANTKIVFMANPSNPTGTYLPVAEMARLHRSLPQHVLLVIDAAYAEYVEDDDYDSGAALAASAPNVIMTRTFSKILGLAALRLGWAYGPPEIVDVLNRTRSPFNVSAPAQAAAVAALADRAHTEKVRRHTARWRQWLFDEIGALGLEVVPSVTNFLLVRFADGPGRGAADADRFLAERGVLLRRMQGYGLADCLRVTVGLEDDNRAVIAALAEFLKG